MNDAANLSNTKLDDKLSIIKTKLPNVDENKLKSLEARFSGPSANGNLPYEFESIVDVNFDYIKSRLSNKSEINSVNNDSQNVLNNKKDNNEIADAPNEDNFNANNINNNNSNKSFFNNLNNSNYILSNGNNVNNMQRNSARKKNESQKAKKTTKSVGGANIEFLAKKRARNEILSLQNNNSNNETRENNCHTTEKKTEKLHFENSNRQNNLKIQTQNSENNSNGNFDNLNLMNSPSSNKAKKPLNSNSDNNLINISNLNPFNNFTTEANFLNNNNNKSNKKSSKENTKKEEIFPSLLNKNEKNGQLSPNISSAIILTVLNSANNLNNISNLNNALNIQNNPNFLSTINDLNQGSQQSEENIEFSSKNICSTANLFYNQKDSANNNNSVGIAKQAFNFMKNQTILDQFNIKAFANPAVYSRNNDRKINAFFNKTATSSAVSANLNSVNSNSNSIINNNNLNINNNNNNNNSFAANAATEDKSIKLLKQNYLKLLEDNEKLVKDLGDKNRFIIEKEKESEKLKLIFLENEQSLKSLCMLNKSFESQINLGKNSLIKYLKEFEELKKTQNKIWLNEQAYRLGKFSIQRMGHRVIEAWEDGEEIKNVKNTVKQIKENKEDLEKLKKRLAAVIKKKEANLNKMEKDNKELNSNINNKESSNNNNNNNKEAFGFYNNNININGLSMGLNAIAASNANGFLHPMNIFHSSNLFGYAHNGNLEEYTEHEMLELKELINFKLARLNKEETECLEKLEKLEIEKIKYQIEFKRNMEEEKCRYGSNSKEKWPVLSNRYLILSLLGRGGYSEVYKAYDLENQIEVACKIHQLNPAWSDSIKENYIRHTIRENQIHKEISHPKVVKHYDTIEIDTSSFCTVLELCSGPDLYTYLKLNKTLPEKDARIIISQILSGVEYLNKLQKKIIHYDLKPQNIIFNNMEVKISDFGLAKIMEDNSDKIELTSQGVGTYWYLPPECFDTDKNPPGISSKVDVWSIGVILYELVFGVRPFGHSLTQERILKENVITNAKKVDFPQKPVVTEECKDFIKNCLAHSQDERYDVFEALEGSFIKGINPRRSKTN